MQEIDGCKRLGEMSLLYMPRRIHLRVGGPHSYGKPPTQPDPPRSPSPTPTLAPVELARLLVFLLLLSEHLTGGHGDGRVAGGGGLRQR